MGLGIRVKASNFSKGAEKDGLDDIKKINSGDRFIPNQSKLLIRCLGWAARCLNAWEKIFSHDIIESKGIICVVVGIKEPLRTLILGESDPGFTRISILI